MDIGENIAWTVDEYNRAQRLYNTAIMRLGLLTQRDLEDQIREEHENQRVMSENQRESPRKPQLKITEVQALLKKGHTRYRKDDKGYGSIQEHYGLSVAQTKELFLHEGLKGLKTKFPGIEIIDDRPTGRTPTNSDTTTDTTTRNLFD